MNKYKSSWKIAIIDKSIVMYNLKDVYRSINSLNKWLQLHSYFCSCWYCINWLSTTYSTQWTEPQFNINAVPQCSSRYRDGNSIRMQWNMDKALQWNSVTLASYNLMLYGIKKFEFPNFQFDSDFVVHSCIVLFTQYTAVLDQRIE